METKYIVGGVVLLAIGGLIYLSYTNKAMRNENTQRTVDSVRRDMMDQSQVPEGIRTQTTESLNNAAIGQYARRARTQAQAYAEANGGIVDTSSIPGANNGSIELGNRQV